MTVCGAETSTGDRHDVPLGDGTTVCSKCADALAHRLRDVPELLVDLEVTLSRQDALGDPGPSVEGTLPWKSAAPDAIWALENTLAAWAATLATRHGQPDPAAALSRPVRAPRPGKVDEAADLGERCEDTGLHRRTCAHCLGLPTVRELPDDAVPARPRQAVATVTVIGQRPPTSNDITRADARWLAAHIGVLRRDVEAVTAHDEIASALAQAEDACGAPAARLFVGACDAVLAGQWVPVLDDDGQPVLDELTGWPEQVPARCTADLFGHSDHRAVTCPRCRTTHTTMLARWYAALRRLEGYPASAATISHHIGELYGLDVRGLRKRINLWHSRNELRMVDRDDDGNPRFRIGEVLARARKAEQRGLKAS